MKTLIVTPTLGMSVYLKETVRSIKAIKAAVDVEHVIVCPANKVCEMANCFPESKVIAENGGGMYAAINDGLRYASYELFTYINDDDVFTPSMVDYLKRIQRISETADVFYARVDRIHVDGRVIGRLPVEANEHRLLRSVRAGIDPLSQPAMVVRYSVFEELGLFDTSYRLCGDFEFWLRALMAGRQFRFIPLVAAQFRQTPGQLSENSIRMAGERERILRSYDIDSVTGLERHFVRTLFRIRNVGSYVKKWSNKSMRSALL